MDCYTDADFKNLTNRSLLVMLEDYARPANAEELDKLAKLMQEYNRRVADGLLVRCNTIAELFSMRGELDSREYADNLDALLKKKYGAGIPTTPEEAHSLIDAMERDDVEPLLQHLEDRAARHAGDSAREARELKSALKKINLKSSSQVVKMAAAGDHPLRVFTVSEALQSGASDEDKKRFLSVQNRLIDGGLYRPLLGTDAATISAVERMRDAFPNFSDVLDSVVVPHVRLCEKNAAHRMPPILLVGPPGVGKTLFASTLASALAAPLLRVDMASEQNNSTLAGSSSFWSNSSPGRLFNLMLSGTNLPPAANPVAFVDELDKPNGDERFSPLSPLYTLLEPHSARTFEDLSLPGLQVDVSHVRWVFSANSVEKIPAPILSRMVIFEIDTPTTDQMREILNSIAKKAAIELGLDFDGTLDFDMLRDAEKMPPRTARICIETAIGVAAADGFDHVTRDAWKTAMRAMGRRDSRVSMGFV
jgi:hypothetical protein